MSTLHVKSLGNDDRLHISLVLIMSADCSDSSTARSIQSFNLSRLKSEQLGLAIERLRLNLLKKLSTSKKSKKKKKAALLNRALTETEIGDVKGGAGLSDSNLPTEAEVEEEMTVQILHSGQCLDFNVSNENAWVEGAVLKIGSEEIPIKLNIPSVIKLEKLPSTIMVGFPLFPCADVEFTDSVEVYWKVFNEIYLHTINKSITGGNIDLSDAFMGTFYIPKLEDIGSHILVACIPKSGDKIGKMAAIISSAKITAGPDTCPFEKRHEFTKLASENGEFRVLSYNILAEVYSDTDFARTQLFSYCPPHALDMGYRKQLILKELLGYQADLMCLQEVDKSMFTSQLAPALGAHGYTGLFKSKGHQVSEGCASFFRNDKFRLVTQLDIILSQFLATDPSCADIWAKICEVPALKEKIEDRSSILQVTVVESLEHPGHFVCLTNTHLYFHPTACNIRLIHVAVAMRYIQRLYDAYRQEDKPLAMVFCGDFNSAPHLGVYQLMTSQFIPSDHCDWSSAGDTELISTLELSQPLNVESACGTPTYTNFTTGFQATLDYIYIDSDKLEVTKVVPMPDHEDVTANVALPSIVFPSDHIALICDLKFKIKST